MGIKLPLKLLTLDKGVYMKIYSKIDELIGKTPLFQPKNIEKNQNLQAKLLLKLEMFNPAGSVKDRVAYKMIEDAIVQGKISKGATIIEPTSGNTGIGIASICASKGFNAILTMPDTMSVERIKLLKAYGAQVVLTDGKLGMKGAIDKAKEIKEKTPNSFICGQFENQSNILAHYQTTGPEIYDDTDGKVDYFVAGIGTGGTISGTGKFLKEKNSKIKVVGIEPFDSPLITKGKSGAHKIQGIGANFIPDNYVKEIVDEVLLVTTEQAYEGCRLLAKEEGLLVGISSGGALFTAIQLAKKEENKGKTIVALLPDTGDRYLSTDLF